MVTQFSRTELVLGKENVEKLKKAKVAIFGIGGVGSFVAEGLARAGIGNFILVDNDTVSLTNINRQLIATHKTIGQNKVDIMTTTPTYLSNMIDLPQLGKAVAQIKVFDVGAEAFPPALYDKIRAVNPDAYIMNGYGPTETTISCTMKVITEGKNITIGTPNGNVQVYVVDKDNKVLPDGETGELVVAGLGVGRGYMNLPEKTAEVFIELNGERAYKTGDLARINPEGEIEFFGRMDNQIKLRGLRIELGEIEEVVNSFEGIVTSVTVPVDNKYLCCYFMADRKINIEELI